MPKKPTPSKVTADQLRSFLTEGRRASCLNELNDEYLLETFAMLKSNTKQWNYTAIARHILNNWGVLAGYKENWIAAQLKWFSDKALGPRRGLRKVVKSQQEQELLEKKAKRIRHDEQKIRKQLSEMEALGLEIQTIVEEVEYWTQRGQERGEPFDVYVPKLIAALTDASKVRHAMAIDYGLVKPAAPSEDKNTINALFLMLQQKIDDPKKMSGMLSAMKNGIAAVAEAAPSELLKETCHGSELQHENCIEVECLDLPKDPDIGMESLSTAPSNQ